jgi:hypothetical protein
MGRKARIKKERKAYKGEFGTPMEIDGNVTPEMLTVADYIFGNMHGELEELTDEVIAELVAKGWPEQDLKWAKSEGKKYSRKRESLWG